MTPLRRLNPNASGLTLAAIYAFGAIAAQGCGKPIDSQSNFPAANLKEAQNIAKRSQITCASADACPEAVGLLTAASPDGAEMCTSFLIAPDLIATNTHCIPEDLKTPGSDCTDRIWVRFASSHGHGEELVSCSTILQATRKTEVSEPDYAVFRLNRPLSRAPFPIAHADLPDGSRFTINKINPVSRYGAIGSLEQVKCVTPHDSLVVPQNDSGAFAPVIALADCTVISGNSGSPVIDEAGAVRAIVQASPKADYPKTWASKEHLALLDGDIAPLGAASSFACVRLASEPANAALPPECSAPPPYPVDQAEKARDAEGARRVSEWLASPAAAAATEHLQWSYANSGSDTQPQASITITTLTLTPNCFKTPLNWLKNTDKTAEIEIDIPVWDITPGITRYFQLSYRISAAPRTVHARLSLSPSELLTRGQSQVELKGPNQTLFDGAIPSCDIK